MDKFYSVYYWNESTSKPSAVQYHIKDIDAATRVAKKAAVEYGFPAYILTTTHLVEAPQPEATVTPIQ